MVGLFPPLLDSDEVSLCRVWDLAFPSAAEDARQYTPKVWGKLGHYGMNFGPVGNKKQAGAGRYFISQSTAPFDGNFLYQPL